MRKMQRTIMVLVAAASVAVTTGCANSPQRLAGEASPVGAVTPARSASPAVSGRLSLSPAPSASLSSSPRTSKTSTPPKKSSKPTVNRVIGPANVLGPTGLGRLQIGMTKEAAEATGMVEAGEGSRDCGSWYLKPDVKGDAVVGWSSRGVVSIPAYDRIATPEGIRIGSTLARVEEAYDDLTGTAADKDGGSWGDGPALAGQSDEYDNVHYRFLFVNGAVVKLILEHDQPRC
jgi:hypothetical protein